MINSRGMKKNVVICGAAIVLLAACIICKLPPKAKPIMLPDAKEITSIEITHSGDKGNITDADSCYSLVEMLKAGQPTRMQSVNDTPPSDYDYFSIRIIDKYDEMSVVFVYADGERVYIEQPYHGIYRADSDLITELENHI